MRPPPGRSGGLIEEQCAGYHQNSWKCVYQVEPASNVTSGRPELLLGGQAAAWGEGLAAHDFDAYVWRGAAAVAERLWSPRNTTDVADALERMGDQMCFMQRHGIYAPPVGPSWCPGDEIGGGGALPSLKKSLI